MHASNPETIYSAGSGDWTQARLITVSGSARNVPMSHRDKQLDGGLTPNLPFPLGPGTLSDNVPLDPASVLAKRHPNPLNGALQILVLLMTISKACNTWPYGCFNHW